MRLLKLVSILFILSLGTEFAYSELAAGTPVWKDVLGDPTTASDETRVSPQLAVNPPIQGDSQPHGDFSEEQVGLAQQFGSNFMPGPVIPDLATAEKLGDSKMNGNEIPKVMDNKNEIKILTKENTAGPEIVPKENAVNDNVQNPNPVTGENHVMPAAGYANNQDMPNTAVVNQNLPKVLPSKVPAPDLQGQVDSYVPKDLPVVNTDIKDTNLDNLNEQSPQLTDQGMPEENLTRKMSDSVIPGLDIDGHNPQKLDAETNSLNTSSDRVSNGPGENNPEQHMTVQNIDNGPDVQIPEQPSPLQRTVNAPSGIMPTHPAASQETMEDLKAPVPAQPAPGQETMQDLKAPVPAQPAPGQESLQDHKASMLAQPAPVQDTMKEPSVQMSELPAQGQDTINDPVAQIPEQPAPSKIIINDPSVQMAEQPAADVGTVNPPNVQMPPQPDQDQKTVYGPSEKIVDQPAPEQEPVDGTDFLEPSQVSSVPNIEVQEPGQVVSDQGIANVPGLHKSGQDINSLNIQESDQAAPLMPDQTLSDEDNNIPEKNKITTKPPTSTTAEEDLDSTDLSRYLNDTDDGNIKEDDDYNYDEGDDGDNKSLFKGDVDDVNGFYGDDDDDDDDFFGDDDDDYDVDQKADWRNWPWDDKKEDGNDRFSLSRLSTSTLTTTSRSTENDDNFAMKVASGHLGFDNQMYGDEPIISIYSWILFFFLLFLTLSFFVFWSRHRVFAYIRHFRGRPYATQYRREESKSLLKHEMV